MRYAVYAPNFNDYGEPARLVELACAAETAGWDGFFVWDHLAFEPDGRLPVADATVVLAAIAQATARIRFGAMITPVARRRPWKLFKELATLDHLSAGRVNLGIGLGEPPALEFAAFGEPAGARERARRLDEGMSILDTLMRGEPVSHHGACYDVETRLAPATQQRPRVPVWVAATLPARAGVRRAARWDGIFPLCVPATTDAPVDSAVDWRAWWPTPAVLTAVVDDVLALRGDVAGFDVVASGSAAPPALQAAMAAAGATWWFEWMDTSPGSFVAALARVRRGPRG
ncbi:MAG: LLM class flavin-dependent oxidoreductase [Gammaproteobacteria bacterium]